MTYLSPASSRFLEALLSFLMAVWGISLPAFIVAFFTPSMAFAVVMAFLSINGACFAAAIGVVFFNRFF